MQLALTGSQFTKETMTVWLTDAGFSDVQFTPLDNYNGVIMAVKQ